jgi:glycosyltransferase involved in cell wall biosynthesis
MKVNIINFNNWLGGVDIFTALLKNGLEKQYNNYDISFNDNDYNNYDISFNDNDLNKYDIIHNNNPYNPIRSDILTFHSLDLRADLMDNVYNAVDKANIITCITEYQKKHLKKEYNIKVDYVINNFSDMLYYPKKMIPAGDSLSVGYIGRLDKDKGISDIYELAERFKNKNVKFYLIGYNQDGYKETENIEILGHFYNRRALCSLIDSIDLFIHPSRLDTMPISILDVIFRKKPIIIKKINSLFGLYKGVCYYSSVDDLEFILNAGIFNINRIEKTFNYCFKHYHPIKQIHKYHLLYSLIVENSI